MKSPTVRHRRLGRELRRLREQAGLSVAEVAVQLGWSPSKVNRIENARIAPSTSDVGNACDLFGADSVTKAGLIQLCRDASQRGWWTVYSDVFSGSYVVLEAESTAIRTWEPLLIPGLLQCEDYAREVLRTRPGLDGSELARRVDARMARKITLLGANAPSFHAIIDESVLHRPVGTPGVMARQLDDLAQVSNWANVTIQILPLTVGANAGLDGAFSILSFDVDDPDVGYTGSVGGEVYVEAADQVRDLKLTFERLADEALPPVESAALIAASKE
ncbi:helix-turn-helix transcriptional regulator [Sphaerisporangium sp. NPDC051011]|uniref:helix-turn-helix domain-containing protein n=1 Tax=Sphaerisporangium sp. NPDC051011 TaxID=3155792 RepID=UPI0033D34DBD